MMKCSKCGAEFEGKFCPECGNAAETMSQKVDNNSTEQAQSVQEPIQTPQQPVANKKKKKPFYKRWWFIVLAIIVVLGVFGKIVGGGNSDTNDEYEEFKWSSFSLHEKLPEPKSKVGQYVFDNSDSLSLTVGETEKNDYKDYVEKCETEFGYSIDKSKTDTSFSASNSENYAVTVLYFESSKEMSISLNQKSENKKDETTSTEKTTEIEKKPDETKPTETKKDESTLVNGMRKDFKEAMDSYEEFYDSYVDFMKSYNASDLTMLAKYTELLSKTAEMDKKFAKWESEDLNDAELAYYIDVQARVSKKLLEVAS